MVYVVYYIFTNGLFQHAEDIIVLATAVSSRSMNGFSSNQGASTSSGIFPEQHNIGQVSFQHGNTMSMRTPSMPQRQVSRSQSSWSQPTTVNPQAIVNPANAPGQQQWAEHQQTFANNLASAGLANFNMSYLAPNVLQDALALSAPVTSADEPILVQQIIQGIHNQDNYKDILNSLHGVCSFIPPQTSPRLTRFFFLEKRPLVAVMEGLLLGA